MNVLLIGSGGREHALAWKISQSPRLDHLYIAPGNAGTALLDQSLAKNPKAKITNVAISPTASDELVSFARRRAVDLVVVGPEEPLANGLADEMVAAGFKVFGPSRAAAQIEASKAFAKRFMARHGIPTAEYATFTDFDAALAHLQSAFRRYAGGVVLKASGLAAGKGVLLPATLEEAESALRQMMLDRRFGRAGDEIVVEERLNGPEVSLIAFCDGWRARPMLPAQDHKRVFDGDQGPNTGGMGAYAPVPICPPALVATLCETILQPAVDGLREEGMPFVGALYAGLMLTPEGARVIEFNCRFGDPETQVILPLLESDILEIFLACTEGRLADVEIRWRDGAAACVVLASGGYPEKYETGFEIEGLEPAHSHNNAFVFHAGTKQQNNAIVTAGGRVLCVTGWGRGIEDALKAAYAAIEPISFAGMHYRKDIGWRVTHDGERRNPQAGDEVNRRSSPPSDYAAAGVDIEAGSRAVELMKTAVKSTYGPEVLAGIGAFGGLFDAAALQKMHHPVLVASTDGVGTKVKLAAQAGRYRSIGHDIVNHCIDDILVQGAQPLFFLDYFATSRLNPEIVAEVVTGIAEACREAKCALLGGETAEMPSVYMPGEFDLAGTIIGVLERDGALPRTDLHPGDVLIGIRSSGPHTNGYSLIRKIFADVPLDTVFSELGVPLADALLAPHRSYLPLLHPFVSASGSPLKALAHLTGGGFVDNLPRVFPDGIGAVVKRDRWPVPPLFKLIQQRGEIASDEMYRVFNMGIGMVAIVSPADVRQFQASLSEETWIIGELTSGKREVKLV